MAHSIETRSTTPRKDKQPPCCARLATKLTQAEGDIRGLARKAAVAASKGRSFEKYRTQIMEAKDVKARALGATSDHEAEHAAS